MSLTVLYVAAFLPALFGQAALAPQSTAGKTTGVADAVAPASVGRATSGAVHGHLMVRCVNTVAGKGELYKSTMLSATAKSMQVRADEGDIDGWIFAHAVIPSGAASNCDYMQMNVYRGFPTARRPVDPFFQKAGVTLSREQWYAKLGESSRLMRVELWRGVEEVGRASKGQFLRIDYLKIPGDRARAWAKFERAQRSLAAARVDKGELTSWQVQELALPAGSAEPYNARVLSVFPSWDAMGRDPLALPERAANDPGIAKMRELVRSELYEIVEAVWPSKAATPR